ncbi:MAG: hypothetical protein U0163_04240 [Gemmatimonadaceae bacterium]
MDGPAKVNVFDVRGSTVVFVGLAGASNRAVVRVRRRGTSGTVLHPGSPSPQPLAGSRDGQDVRWTVPLVRGCALLVVPGSLRKDGHGDV